MAGDASGKAVAGAGRVVDFVQGIGAGGEEFPARSEEQSAVLLRALGSSRLPGIVGGCTPLRQSDPKFRTLDEVVGQSVSR